MFDSKEWKRGLKIMESIREKTSDAFIGKQLVGLFKEAQQRD